MPFFSIPKTLSIHEIGGVSNACDINERPHQNEKTEALAYVRQLMEQARKESNHEELPN